MECRVQSIYYGASLIKLKAIWTYPILQRCLQVDRGWLSSSSSFSSSCATSPMRHSKISSPHYIISSWRHLKTFHRGPTGTEDVRSTLRKFSEISRYTLIKGNTYRRTEDLITLSYSERTSKGTHAFAPWHAPSLVIYKYLTILFKAVIGKLNPSMSEDAHDNLFLSVIKYQMNQPQPYWPC